MFPSSSTSSRGLIHGMSSRYLRTSGSDRNVLSETNPWTRSERTDALMSRLEELLVFEILKDGPATYKRFSVRTLYKYVISAITRGGLTDYPRPIEALRLKKEGKSSRNIQAGVSKRSSRTLSAPQDGSDSDGSDDDDNEDGDDEEEEEENADDKNNESNVPQSTTRRRRRKSKKKKKNSLIAINESESLKDEDLQKNVDKENANDNEVTYRERLGGFLHPRDMRKLVTPFSASNEPEIIVRRHAILLNFDPMRAIILRDRLLVLVPDGADSILVELERRVRGGAELDSIGGKTPSVSAVDPTEEVVREALTDPTARFNGPVSSTDSVSSSESKGGIKRAVASSVASVVSNVSTRFRVGAGNNYIDSPSIPRGGYDDKTSEAGTSETTRMDSAVSSLDSEGSDSYNSFADNEWNELEGRGWIDLPFELQGADAVLHCVASILAEDVLELQMSANSVISSLLAPHADIGDRAQEILRNMKNSIEEMRSRVKGFVRAMDVLLEDYEDMSLMNLSRLLTHPERFIQPVPQSVLEEESDEPELILESHLQEGNTLTNALYLIRGQVSATEDFVSRKSDSMRNKLLFIDLVISVLSLAVAIGSFVGSVFGMNVPNQYERETDAFRIIVYATIGGCIAMVMIALLIIRKLGALPSFFH